MVSAGEKRIDCRRKVVNSVQIDNRVRKNQDNNNHGDCITGHADVMLAAVTGIVKNISVYQNVKQNPENQKNQDLVQKQRPIPLQNKKRIHERKVGVKKLRRIKSQNDGNDAVLAEIQSINEKNNKQCHQKYNISGKISDSAVKKI